MRTRIKKRGSALIIVVFTATAIAVIAVAGVGLSGAVSNNQSKKEKSKEMDYVMDGAAELATSDLAAGRLPLNSPKTYYVGGKAVTVTAVDNSGNLANTAKLVINGNEGGSGNGNAFGTNKTVAFTPRAVKNIWSYAVYSNGNTEIAGGSKIFGSLFTRRNPTAPGGGLLSGLLGLLGLGSVGTITNNFETVSSYNPMGILTVQGAILTGISPETFPTLSTSTYTGAATTVLTGNQTLNGYTFPSGSGRDVTVVNGNLTLQGAISHDGAFYVTGSITINGNLTFQSGAKHLVVITPNDITFDGSGSSLTAYGYFFAGGMITVTDKLSITGGLVATTIKAPSAYTVTWDSWLTQTASNGAAMHAPDMWP